MRPRSVVTATALFASSYACSAVVGLDDYTTDDAVDASVDAGVTRESGVAALPDGSSAAETGAGDGGSMPEPINGDFAYRRVISLSSDAATTFDAYDVLVTLPASFAYAHTKPNGDDLRFSTSPVHADDLDYFIEVWNTSGPSSVWVRVPKVAPGARDIHLFYGGTATAASSFDKVFPNARKTAGAGKGSFTATGDINVDWFELGAGDTLTLQAQKPLAISAYRIIFAGNVDGTGKGNLGGLPEKDGTGPGAGKFSSGSGGGGGGYGGAGGRGGSDSPGAGGAGGAGGAAYGSASDDSFDLGSGGGGTKVSGGAGGGALFAAAWRVTIGGKITMNGAKPAEGSGQESGGGSGGSILLAGAELDIGAGAALSANGGDAGDCHSPANDGGGGGGGGRIKLRPRGAATGPATITVAGGATSQGGCQVGTPGSPGTTNTTTATLLKGVAATVGDEQALR